MRVYVKVEGGESFPIRMVRNKPELTKILDFARIGSQTGEPRRVYRARGGDGRWLLIGRYVKGESESSSLMRARRSPFWNVATVAALFGLKKLITG